VVQRNEAVPVWGRETPGAILRGDTVGERLARAALAVSYGREVAYRGPALVRIEREAEALRLTFAPESGARLEFAGDPRALAGFELAGADGVFLPASAVAETGGVRVFREGLARPLAVRYGWANAPELSVRDSNGLPTPPFQRRLE
jgi:sialate O-acetylesterase